MQYYSYDLGESLIKTTKNHIKSFPCTYMDNIDSTLATALTSKTILDLVHSLKLLKQDYKTLAYKFNQLQPWEKLNLINRFYIFQTNSLKEWQKDEYKKQYPAEKVIKLNIINLNHHPYTYNDTEVLFYAKDKKKLNIIKGCSNNYLSLLINSGEVMPISATVRSYGNPITKKDRKKCVNLNVELIPNELMYTKIDEDTYNAMLFKNANVVNELLNDIDSAKIIKDYESKFLPAYKKMLDYCTKCARVTAEYANSEKLNAQKRISQANEELKDLQEVKKAIIDTSKGR